MTGLKGEVKVFEVDHPSAQIAKLVDDILLFIVRNSGKGSAVLFDYFPQSVVDGASQLEVVRNIYNQLMQIWEPLQFGLKEGMVEKFLEER